MVRGSGKGSGQREWLGEWSEGVVRGVGLCMCVCGVCVYVFVLYVYVCVVCVCVCVCVRCLLILP